jgi:DNA mismatch repair protein MutS
MTPTAAKSRWDMRLDPPRGGFFVADSGDSFRARCSMGGTTTPNVVDCGRVRQPVKTRNQALTNAPQSSCFVSILFAGPQDRNGDDELTTPAFFADLNCNQVVSAIVSEKEAYDLKPFFHNCLKRVDAITYRHQVFKDLEDSSLHECIDNFGRKMREVREGLGRAQKAHYKEQKQAWFLDAVMTYCDTMNSLTAVLSKANLKSRGFIGLRNYMRSYAGSVEFTSLLRDAEKLKSDLAGIAYCVLINGTSFTVRRYEEESDYSIEVEETFDKFKSGAAKDYKLKFSTSDDMNHIEAKILEFVAKLNYEIFSALDAFCVRNVNFVDRTVEVFDREVQFYVAYVEYVAALKGAGLQFCYPRISEGPTSIRSIDSFDIALARKLVAGGSPVICNDFSLCGEERILVISGPNQGGKTTFARTFGQLHYLASIGCPVPGTDAQLLLFDCLFTQFEKEEKVEDLRGKLEDDLVRIHGILGRATRRSIIVLNEVFTSTTIRDEVFLSRKVMEKLVVLKAVCVWVTFVDELATFSPQTVSMVSTVVPDNPALRTFKVVRRPADGLAYAMAIARKYQLTYEAVVKRIKS